MKCSSFMSNRNLSGEVALGGDVQNELCTPLKSGNTFWGMEKCVITEVPNNSAMVKHVYSDISSTVLLPDACASRKVLLPGK